MGAGCMIYRPAGNRINWGWPEGGAGPQAGRSTLFGPDADCKYTYSTSCFSLSLNSMWAAAAGLGRIRFTPVT